MVNSQLTPAEKLCQWLGYLPLGLELVGRYLERKPDLSLEEMLDRLQAKRLEQRSLNNLDATMTAQLGVRDAFELSWQELDEPAKQLEPVHNLLGMVYSLKTTIKESS